MKITTYKKKLPKHNLGFYDKLQFRESRSIFDFEAKINAKSEKMGGFAPIMFDPIWISGRFFSVCFIIKCIFFLIFSIRSQTLKLRT